MLANPAFALKGLLFLLIFAGGLFAIAYWVNKRLIRDQHRAVTKDEETSILITRGVLVVGTIALEALIFTVVINVMFMQ